MIKKIKKNVDLIFDDVVSFRRHIHMNPELSFQEKETAAFISRILKKYKISHTKGWAKHGIIAKIGKKGKKSVGLRADMDALPILEVNDVSYKSKNEGIMHACGHDVHSSSLLGAAIILKKIENDLPGQVICVFQPGEEKLPGGASILIKEGLFKKNAVDAMIGQHVHPPLESGKVGFRSGTYMASADEIYINVFGKGGHGALPQNCIDPIYVSSQIISALQSIVSRNANPHDPSVLTFGKFNSIGGAPNVIPNQVKLEGTFRAMNEKWRKEVHRLIKRIAKQTAASFGATCKVDIRVGYPCLKNHVQLTDRLKENAINYLGKRNVIELPKRMTAEDFSYYSQIVPACFYRLGTGNKSKGITSPVHTNTFNIDESALSIGAGLMVLNAIRELSY